MPNEPNQPNRDQRKSPRQPERERQHDSTTAEDRGRSSSADRRSFGGDREADELGSELERETGIEQDDEDMDEPGRRDR